MHITLGLFLYLPRLYGQMKKKRNIRYVAYIRVSTDKQEESGLGLEAQQSMIKTYVQPEGRHCLSVHQEVASGKQDDRPILAQAIQEAKQQKAVLLVAKLDRLSRDAAFLFNIRKRGIQIETCEAGEMDTLMLGILGTIAQNERELISKRTTDALQALKARGTVLGSPLLRTTEGKLLLQAKAREAKRAKATERNARAVRFVRDYLVERKGDISLSVLCRRMKREGYTAPRGGQLNHVQVIRLMERAAEGSFQIQRETSNNIM